MDAPSAFSERAAVVATPTAVGATRLPVAAVKATIPHPRRLLAFVLKLSTALPAPFCILDQSPG
jgi:hypothetical protein